jgi:hypothetical protein
MRKILVCAAILSLGFCACLWADWASTGGNPQRDGWSQGNTKVTKEAIENHQVKLLWTYKFENEARGLDAMTAPIDLSRIIGWQGFKELLFIGGSSNVVYSLDSDLGVLYFKTAFQTNDTPSAAPTVLCPGGLTATLAMPGSSGGGGFRFRGPARGRAPYPARGRGAPARRGFVFRMPGPAVFWAVSSDGYLRTLREQDGNASWIPPVKFLPANARVSGINVSDDVIYAATINSCGGNPNGLYAAQYTAPELPKMPGEPLVTPAKFQVSDFMTNGSGFSGTGGTAIGTNGIVYGQVAEGHGSVAGNYNDTVLALNPKTLAVEDYFTPSGSMPPMKTGVESPNVTPAYFSWNGKELLVAGGRDGRLYLLDATSLGGADHHTPLYRSQPVVNPDSHFGGNGIWGTFATWEDAASNTRWIYAAIRGPAAMKFPTENGSARDGAIVAFKVVDQGGKPALSPQWISRDMLSPAAPAIAGGLVYALSTGLSPRVAHANGSPYTVAEMEKMAKPAVLYILDGATGQQLFSSGHDATTFASSGIAVANGNDQAYFTTHDNTLFAYGVPEIR